MKKDELAAEAAQENSELRTMGSWARARLDARPEAGKIVFTNGHWYVAVAGQRREGSYGTIGGLYSRWVEIPAEICKDWTE